MPISFEGLPPYEKLYARSAKAEASREEDCVKIQCKNFLSGQTYAARIDGGYSRKILKFAMTATGCHSYAFLRRVCVKFATTDRARASRV
jgi:hypothetical protein